MAKTPTLIKEYFQDLVKGSLTRDWLKQNLFYPRVIEEGTLYYQGTQQVRARKNTPITVGKGLEYTVS